MFPSTFVLFHSKVLGVWRHISAHRASQGELFSIWRMCYFEWTFGRARTLREFTPLFPRDVITCALSFVTWLTEVCVTPAEPLGYVATEFALELDEVRPVDLALGSTYSQGVSCTFTADQLLCLEFLLLLLSSQTVLQPSEVRILTSMAQVVSTLEDCKLGYVVVVWIARVL